MLKENHPICCVSSVAFKSFSVAVTSGTQGHSQ